MLNIELIEFEGLNGRIMNNEALRSINTLITLLIIYAFVLLLASCSQSTSPTPVTPVPGPTSEEVIPSKKYDITISFVDQNITLSQQQVFLDAADVWQQVIKADLGDVQTNIPAGSCGDDDPGFSGTIDDIMIIVSAPNIDGPSGILGQAGPCGIRNSNPNRGLPFYGLMAFDAADIAKAEAAGNLKNLILHEMGHVLGIGTLWDSFEVISGAGSDDPTFIGANALAEWNALGGSGNVPVENEGGTGTRDGHWRESVFDTELMTGFNDPVQQLSRLTIASLQDLTYSVDFSAAQAYALPVPLSLETLSQDEHNHSHSIPTTTRFNE